MNVFSWVIVGLISGISAGMFIRRGSYGLIGDIVVGVVGGLLGGFLASTFPRAGGPTSGITLESVLVAFVGAVILLILSRFMTRVQKTKFH